MNRDSVKPGMCMPLAALILTLAAGGGAQCPPDTLLATLNNPAPISGESFGFSVAISGNTAVAGAPFGDPGGVTNAGRAYVLDAATGALLATLDNPAPAGNDQFGWSVAVSGGLAVVGAPLDNPGGVDNSGTAYLFDATTGALVATLNNPSPETDAYFGFSVAVSGGIAVVGAYQAGGLFSPDRGRAHVFDATTGAYLRTLFSPDANAFDEFGWSVALSGSLAVVGARGDDPGGVSNAGTAYVFNTTTGALVATLSNPTPNATDHFGNSVAISGNTAVVGAYHDDPPMGPNAGTAYVFDATTGALVATLNNPAPGLQDQFGTSVAVSGNIAVVGADQDSPGGTAYVFNATTGALLATLNSTPPTAGDFFGASVAISGDIAVVGAYQDDPGGVGDAGTAYVFTCASFFPSPTPTPSSTPTPTATPTPVPPAACPLLADRPQPAGNTRLFNDSTVNERWGQRIDVGPGPREICRIVIYGIDRSADTNPLSPPMTFEFKFHPDPLPSAAAQTRTGVVPVAVQDTGLLIDSDRIHAFTFDFSPGVPVPSGQVWISHIQDNANSGNSLFTLASLNVGSGAEPLVQGLGGSDIQPPLRTDLQIGLEVYATNLATPTPSPNPTPTPVPTADCPSIVDRPQPAGNARLFNDSTVNERWGQRIDVGPSPREICRIVIYGIDRSADTDPLSPPMTFEFKFHPDPLPSAAAQTRTGVVPIAVLDTGLLIDSDRIHAFTFDFSPGVPVPSGLVWISHIQDNANSGNSLFTLASLSVGSGGEPLVQGLGGADIHPPARTDLQIGLEVYAADLATPTPSPYPTPSATATATATSTPTRTPTPTPCNLDPINGGFESGDFTSWAAEDVSMPGTPIQVAAAGVTSPFFTSAPTEGGFAALHGWSATGGAPGVIRLWQEAGLSPSTTLLSFDYRAGWDMTGISQPRQFSVVIEPSGGGTPLQAFQLLNVAGGAVLADTGNRSVALGLEPYAGMTVRIAFEWTVPGIGGSALFQLDGVELECTVCCPGDADNSGGNVNANDFLAVQASFGANNGVGGLGDADCSGGNVNANDFLAVQANFGANCG